MNGQSTEILPDGMKEEPLELLAVVFVVVVVVTREENCSLVRF